MADDGDRIITSEDYEALTKAIDQVEDARDKLDKGVEALQAVIQTCCLHRGKEKLAS
jgi:hypothetical protein